MPPPPRAFSRSKQCSVVTLYLCSPLPFLPPSLLLVVSVSLYLLLFFLSFCQSRFPTCMHAYCSHEWVGSSSQYASERWLMIPPQKTTAPPPHSCCSACSAVRARCPPLGVGGLSFFMLFSRPHTVRLPQMRLDARSLKNQEPGSQGRRRFFCVPPVHASTHTSDFLVVLNRAAAKLGDHRRAIAHTAVVAAVVW